MYAVIKTGGKQYKVRVGESIDVEKLAAEEGAQVRLDQVLLAANEVAGPIEREPLVHRPAVRLELEREHVGVGDRVVRAVEDVIRLLAVVVDRFARNCGDRAAIVTQRQPGHAAHTRAQGEQQSGSNAR